MLVERERDKYQRMWAHPEYRQNSPGERLLTDFLHRIPWQKGDTLIDLGCGTGRAAAKLHHAGLKVSMLDITETSLDPLVRQLGLPFYEACLWEPLELPTFDWFYCTDVLEHLPLERVDMALDSIQSITGKGGYFQVAMFNESFGDMIGETLHLTVQSIGYWQPKIIARWKAADFVTIEKGRFVATVRRANVEG